MKKILSIVMASILMFALVACGAKKDEVKKDAPVKTEEDAFKPKQVAAFADVLDNLGNKDLYYSDTTVIKILDKPSMKAYKAKALAITTKAMSEKSVDLKNAKVYTYYKNVNGTRSQRDYVVVYDATKAPTDLYQVDMKVSDSDEPTLDGVKKVEKAVDDNFKKYFNGEVK